MSGAFTTSPDGWMQSAAGGLRWRENSDGSYEIEGQGVPLAPMDGYFADAKFIDTSWANYGDKITEKSQRFGVPSPLILAIGIVESRWKNTLANSAGAGGVMALMPATLQHYVPGGHMNDIDDNMDAGILFLADLMKRYDGQVPAVAPAYNHGSADPSQKTKCKSTIDGKWQFDGTSAVNSMGFVEDCQKGRSSAYSYRVTSLVNSILAKGIGTAPPDSGPSSSGSGIGGVIAAGVIVGGVAGLAMSLAEEDGFLRRFFRW